MARLKAVPLHDLPGLKATLQGGVFTGLKAGAFTVVPLSRHLDADRIFPQAVQSCSFTRCSRLPLLLLPAQSKSGRWRAVPGLRIETRASLRDL
jgi:hypothetical protein